MPRQSLVIALFGYEFSRLDIPIFFTLLFLEGILSFDNAAVLAAMVRKLPVEQRRKALMYGLLGAYVFRITAILGVAFIIENPLLRILGGLYLVLLAVKHFLPRRSGGDEAGFANRLMERVGVSGFWGVVVLVELTDVAFALDQVLAAVALTDKLPLIIAASLIAIVFLRISAAYMARLMDWFPQLESLAYAAVGFVGAKLVVEDVFHVHVPKVLSIGVTLSLIVLPVLVKFALERARSAKAAP